MLITSLQEVQFFFLLFSVIVAMQFNGITHRKTNHITQLYWLQAYYNIFNKLTLIFYATVLLLITSFVTTLPK